MKLIKWLTDNEAKQYHCVNYITGGRFQYGMRWKEYIKDFENRKDIIRINLIRAYILENQIKELKDNYQNTIPLYDDDKIIIFSFRAFGDLLAATWAEAEDQDYTYSLFSW